jgi:hypothetical protein
MSIVLLGSTSGSITLQEPAVAGSNVLSLPAATGTVALTENFTGSNVSLTSNGYQKLPSGLIMQWGYVTVDGAVTFPIAFPNACLSLTFGSNGTGNGIPRSGVGSVTTTGFVYTSATNSNQPAYWFAVGY